MRELIEVGIGETVEINNKSYICVIDNPHVSCCGCAFLNTGYCDNIACVDAEREDKADVHFVKQRELYARTLYLKIKPEYFEAVKSGKKTFEVRFDDRGFKVGDIVVLREIDARDSYQFTGRYIEVEITYIFDDAEYCKPGFVVFGFKVVGSEEGGKE